MSTCALPGCLEEANKTCVRCNKARYCSKQCQKSHWREHKKFCNKLAGSSTTSGGDEHFYYKCIEENRQKQLESIPAADRQMSLYGSLTQAMYGGDDGELINAYLFFFIFIFIFIFFFLFLIQSYRDRRDVIQATLCTGVSFERGSIA